MTTLVTFLLAGVGTYLIRISMMLLEGRATVAAWIEDRLAFVGPSVLAAIVASAVFVTDGSASIPRAAEVLAVLGAWVAVRRTGSVGAALAIGFPIYWLGIAVGLT